MKKETKILMGILLVIVLVTSIGIVIAHGTEERGYTGGMRDMEEMMDNGNMMSEMMTNGEMENMMHNGEMSEMMEEHMAEMGNMMDDEDMLEHMKDCPMMKNYN